MAVHKLSGIYAIVNLENGKRYVGSAVNLARRWREHTRQLQRGVHPNRYLQSAWLKYGECSFEFSVVMECSPERLIEEEQGAMDRMAPEYNLSPTAGSTLGFRFSEESRAKLSRSMMGKGKGVTRDPALVAKTAEAHRGKVRSPETGRKISEKLKGRQRDPAHVEAAASKLRGRKRPPEEVKHLIGNKHACGQVFSDERRASMAAATREQYANGERSRERPPEYREKIAASLRGRKLTPEHRAAVSAAMTGKKRGPYKKKAATE